MIGLVSWRKSIQATNLLSHRLNAGTLEPGAHGWRPKIIAHLQTRGIISCVGGNTIFRSVGERFENFPETTRHKHDTIYLGGTARV